MRTRAKTVEISFVVHVRVCVPLLTLFAELCFTSSRGSHYRATCTRTTADRIWMRRARTRAKTQRWG